MASVLLSLSTQLPPVLVLAGFGAGLINAIAGGGPVLTLGVMSLIGFDPRLANLTSTVALCPGQLYAGWTARRQFADLERDDKKLAPVFVKKSRENRESRAGNDSIISHPALGRKQAALLGIGLIGGAAGAWLLLATSSGSFRYIVPWLILFATAIYAMSGRALSSQKTRGFAANSGLKPAQINGLFMLMAVYGGYFGGGNSFLVLALIVSLGFAPHVAAALKNGLIAAINLGAVMVFVPSGLVDWQAALALGIGGIAGSFCGVRLLGRISAGLLRALVIAIGVLLAIWFFAS